MRLLLSRTPAAGALTPPYRPFLGGPIEEMRINFYSRELATALFTVFACDKKIRSALTLHIQFTHLHKCVTLRLALNDNLHTKFIITLILIYV